MSSKIIAKIVNLNIIYYLLKIYFYLVCLQSKLMKQSWKGLKNLQKAIKQSMSLTL